MENDQLNEEQLLAVNTTEGPLLVIAGAGSGKTRVVTMRIAHLLQKGISPHKILGLTFTNKAANEMKERVHSLTQSNVLICTFHSLGARILRDMIHHLGYQRTFTIYDDSDIEQLIRACINEVTQSDGKPNIKEYKNFISNAKNNLRYSAESINTSNAIAPRVYARYQEKLKEYNAVDYDDLLALPVRLFSEHPEVLLHYQQRWSHLLIDEYQDTNTLQYTLVNYLVNKSRNLCVVGDPDQSIYSWRGANIQNILNFEQDYPGAIVVRLDQNYRSRSNILDAANALILRNENRYEKKLWSARGEGEKIKQYTADTDKSEATYVADRILEHHRQQNIPLNEMVVFYRTNAQSRVFEDYMLNRRIPYVIVGGISFYQRREVKDILAWLRMVLTDSDYISFVRTINLPKRGIGDATLDKLRLGASEEQLPIIDYCIKLLSGEPLQTPVKLTARQSQGLQEYLKIIMELRLLSQTTSLAALVTATIDRTRYWEYLEEDKETLQDRKENLNALVSKAAEWEEAAQEPSLQAFLEELSLKSTLDETSEETDRVSLMTIHNGKGLEFEVTFLVGLEEGLFPHINSINGEDEDKKDDAIEEERRLCYVGMTRAKEYLYLTLANTRTIWGVTRSQRPSRFLREIPANYVEKSGMSSSFRPFGNQAYQSHRPKFVNKETQNDAPMPEQVQTQSAPQSSFAVGDLIFHKEFGIGYLRQVYEGSAGLTYKIVFSKDKSEKNLVAKYAQLTKL